MTAAKPPVILQPLRRLSLQLLFLLGCYFLSRCCFVLLNLGSFKGLDIAEFFRLAFHGLRYDISALLALNGVYIFLLLLPLPVWKMPLWDRVLQYLFIITNLVALLFEISDWAYFPFNFKRSTIDVLEMLTRKGDFLSLLPGFVVQYWYVLLAAVLLFMAFVKINRMICRATSFEAPAKYSWKIPTLQTLRLLLVGGLCVIGIRGGLQYIPIGIRNAVQVADSKYTPIVLNTPFSIINSYANDALEELHYFPDQELDKYIATSRHFSGKPFSAKNVVVIILESFSKEFTGIGGLTSYTPFLDSLMGQSLVCTNAYANALRSAEGIPAILAGIPSLQEEPFTTSLYGTDRITALPGILALKNYSSAFFHGGTNGTMSFDVFTANAGFKRYKGRTEYADEKDYDGNWGIWDEPFLQYTARELGKLKEPFCAGVFTLSSHPPYSMPEQYEGKFPKGTLPVHQCIGYTDHALRQFFKTAAAQSWFSNTLFVIVADHCSPQSDNAFYQSKQGKYAIPVVFYAPGDASLRGTYGGLVQQIDILPSVLQYLGYDQRFFAFGNSIFDANRRAFVVNHVNSNYWWLMDNYLLETADMQPTALYHYASDSLCSNNIIATQNFIAVEKLQYLKAFMQQYNNALIHNRLWIE